MIAKLIALIRASENDHSNERQPGSVGDRPVASPSALRENRPPKRLEDDAMAPSIRAAGARAGTDAEIAYALDALARTVEQLRKRFVEGGIEAALLPEPTKRIACSIGCSGSAASRQFAPIDCLWALMALVEHFRIRPLATRPQGSSGITLGAALDSPKISVIERPEFVGPGRAAGGVSVAGSVPGPAMSAPASRSFRRGYPTG